jgi:ornithine decarboxylase
MLARTGMERVIEWASLEKLPTPTFLFLAAPVREAVARLRETLGGRISYAAKANPHPLALRELAPVVDEFNVTNLVHLDALLESGVAPSRILLAHPVLGREVANAALERGITRFVLDCPRGLRLLRELTSTAAVTLRMRPPDAGQSTHSLVRFGNTRELLRTLAREVANAGFRIEALSFFVGTSGSEMEKAKPFCSGLRELAALRHDLDRDGIAVPLVNIGGGFPGARRVFHRDHPGFFSRIRAALLEYFGPAVDFVSEPGRFLSEPSLALLSRVVADRSLAGRRFVHLDASAYAGLFESCFIADGGSGPTIEVSEPSRHRTPASVLGPIMDSFDVIRRAADLPLLEEGELVLLPNVGAYAWSYTTASEGLAAPSVLAAPDWIGRQLGEGWHAA